MVARTIARAPVPVLTGIVRPGERTLADEVAYQALATPGSAAAFVIGRLRAAHSELGKVWHTVEAAHRAARDRLRAARERTLLRLATAVVTLLAAISLVYVARPDWFVVIVVLLVLLGGGGLVLRSRTAQPVEPGFDTSLSIGQLEFEAGLADLARVVVEL